MVCVLCVCVCVCSVWCVCVCWGGGRAVKNERYSKILLEKGNKKIL